MNYIDITLFNLITYNAVAPVGQKHKIYIFFAVA